MQRNARALAVTAVLVVGAVVGLVVWAASLGPATRRAEPSPAPASVSAPVAAASPTPFRLNTPGPTIPAGHWRWRGSVIDLEGKPLEGVCVHIGPADCRPNSVRTDDKGEWVIDFPQVDVFYEFHFIKTGYQQVDETIRTTGPGELRIRMIPPRS